MSTFWNNWNLKKVFLTSVTFAFVLSEISSIVHDLYLQRRKRHRRLRPEKKCSEIKSIMKASALSKTNSEPVTATTNLESVTDDTDDDRWNTALFFPDYFPDRENSTTQQFIWYLQQTKKMMKICMYVSSFRTLEKVVFDLAKEKGIHVLAVTNVPRVVTVWKKHGIRIREKPKMIQSAFSKDIFVDTMHNKFIIIDDRAVLGGSLNWTRSAVCENRENVVITNNSGIVNKFLDEFDRLWELSEPDQ